jgi:hypothetical protein
VKVAGATAAVLAVGLLYIAFMPWELDARLSFDAVRYYAGAESILETGRFTDLDGGPQQQWPPGVSLLYAMLSAVTGADALALVPTVNVVSYVLLVAALAWLVWLSGLEWWIAAAGLAVVALNGFYLSMHNKLWSEPPSLAMLVVAILCLAVSAHVPRHANAALAGACLAAAAAIMTRYAFLALVPLIVVFALATRRRVMVVAALLTPLPTVLALTLLGASRGKRALAVQSVPWGENAPALVALGDQVFPARWLGWGAAVLFVVLCIAVPLVVALRAERSVARTSALVAFGWTISYSLFLPFTQAVVVPPPVIDLRMLFPLYAGAMIGLAASGELAARGRSRVVAVLLTLPLALAGARAARATIHAIGKKPPAMACVSRTAYVDAIRAAAPRGTVATNASATVWLALRRPVLRGGPAESIVWIDPARACPHVVEDDAFPRPAGEADQRGLLVARGFRTATGE